MSVFPIVPKRAGEMSEKRATVLEWQLKEKYLIGWIVDLRQLR